MKSPRSIVVKTLFSADEFLTFDTVCASSDISHSKALRDLANAWANDRRKPVKKEWPEVGQNMAMFLPGRANYGAQATSGRL